MPSFILVGLVGWVAIFALYAPAMPDTEALLAREEEPKITVLAADGTVLADAAGGGGRFVTLDQIAPALVQAVIATEDQRFWRHFGLDPLGIGRALMANLRAGEVAQGGSTITQQLAKLLFLKPERSLKRKLEEATLALWLEARLDKTQILTLYLNKAYLGAGTYGVEAAARRYFAKPARELNLAEAAMIAGLLKAPSALAPTNDLASARDRAGIVLGRMVAEGYVDAGVATAARARPAKLALEIQGDLAGHFVDWAVDGVIASLGRPSRDLVVRTTLDRNLQRHARDRVKALLAAPGAKQRVGEAAIVMLGTDGAVRAMVGGESYRASQLNRAVEARRQPGSAFKPFVYLAALEAGYQPGSMIEDRPIRIGSWAPGNFDGRYRGTVSLTEAFAQSLNTPAVRLVQALGVERVVEVAHRLGVASVIKSVPSAALGTSEVTLLELTGAYLPFATGGLQRPVFGVTEIIEAGNRRPVYRHRQSETRVIGVGAADTMATMFRAAVEDGTGRAAAFGGRAIAGKTGTTQNSRDAWFVGWGGGLLLGVWLGNDDGAPMGGVSGGTLPARLWREVMEVTPPPRPEPAEPAVAERPSASGDGSPPPSGRNIPEELAGKVAGWLGRLVEDALATARN